MIHVSLFLSAVSSMLAVALMALSRKQHHWKILLAFCALLYFALAGFRFLVVLGLSGFIYLSALEIRRMNRGRWLVYIVVLLPLVLKKALYAEFHFDELFDPSRTLIQQFDWVEVLNFVGLSYFTFNGLSYLIDVKRKYLAPQRNFFVLLLYLIYFPTIFSGPLHRAKYFFNELSQIQVTNESLANGSRLILWGLFKNMVVAQRLHFLVYSLMEAGLGGLFNLLTGFFFFFFLYCSFSSFIQIFQGVSQVFNIRLKDNFRNRVYASASRQEFWGGWHITLNEWFRDYFFYELVRYDKRKQYTYGILFLTFLLIGLWHDFTLVFLVWGAMNATWIILEKKFYESEAGKRHRKVRPLGVLYHLFFSSLLATVFISPDLGGLLDVFTEPPSLGKSTSVFFSFNTLVLVIAFIAMDYHEKMAGKQRMDHYLAGKPELYRWAIYYKLAFMILLFGTAGIIENYYRQF
ncbi:MAG: hypothetical protein RI973_1823 [Bacteroidota bacterium]